MEVYSLEDIFFSTRVSRNSSASLIFFNSGIEIIGTEIVNFLNFECFANFIEVKVINENLQQMLLALNAPISRVGLLKDGLKTVLTGPSDYFSERKELAGLVFHFMRRCLFSKERF